MSIDIEAIQTRMEVVSEDGRHMGVVDAILPSELKLACEPGSQTARAFPLGFIKSVDTQVRLVVTEAETRRRWRETH